MEVYIPVYQVQLQLQERNSDMANCRGHAGSSSYTAQKPERGWYQEGDPEIRNYEVLEFDSCKGVPMYLTLPFWVVELVLLW